MKYNPWPLGELPKEFQRPEPEQIRKMGYQWDDPRDIIDIFEKKVAKFAGSNYAVATDSCSHAIFLGMVYEGMEGNILLTDYIYIPRQTYASVPMQIQYAGFDYVFQHRVEWTGFYRIDPTRVIDAALRWTKGMYIKDSLMCLSFQIKKRIPIGRGGMILCDKKDEYEWLKLASYDGRDLNTPYDSKGHIKMDGWHYYMTPEDAARGIILMDNTPEVNEDQGGWENYPSLQHK
jgi:dTDP-4-amino-4,6-dideoxygalactose transaminase